MMRYGMIGCGMMGQEHLRNIRLLPDTRIAAIFEPDPAMLSRSVALAPEAAPCALVAELLARPDLDCLVIASLNQLHLDQLEQAASFRPLPVLIEKPLFTQAADLVRIQRLRRDHPAPV